MPSDKSVIPPCMIDLGGNRYRCPSQDFVVETTQLPIHCHCVYRDNMEGKQSQSQSPDITEAVKRLDITDNPDRHARALQQWAKADYPVRTAEDIKRIYREHCEPCKHRNKQADTCGVCGCGDGSLGLPLPKKLKMATQGCPRGSWRPVKHRPTLIVVAGLHRSFSSCLAEMLGELGVYMGTDLNGGEDAALAWLCEELMPFPQSKPVLTSAQRQELLTGWLANHLEAAGGCAAGAKYPHLCVMLPELSAACKQLNVRLRVVDLARRHGACKVSLADRAEKAKNPKFRATREQCRELQEALAAGKKAFFDKRKPDAQVAAARLMCEPDKVVDELCGTLGLAPTPEQRQRAIATVDPGRADHGFARASGLSEVEILIKSFMRFDRLLWLVRSIRARYPKTPILIADDSLQDGDSYPREALAVMNIPGVRWYRMPFDSGLSAGRNLLVQRSTAPYLLVAEDDFMFTKETRLGRFQDILRAAPELDAIAGLVRMNGRKAVNWNGRCLWGYEEGSRDASGGRKTLKLVELSTSWQRAAGHRYRETELVWNFFLARRELLEECPWDERLKIWREHLDWLLTVGKAGKRLAYTSEVLVDHFKGPNSAEYGGFRTCDPAKAFREKWQLARIPKRSMTTEPNSQPHPPPSRIPRVFHRIWIGGQMPEQHRRWVRGWEAFHPHWRHRTWNEAQIRQFLTAEERKLFEAAPTASQKSDVARYAIVAREGGVYVDTDYECLRRIDELLKDCPGAFVAQCNSKRDIASGIFGAEAGHPFMKAILAAMPGAFNPADPLSLSPPLITAVADGRDDLKIFERHIFLPVGYWEKERLAELEYFPRSYAVHHFAASWKEK